jgi:NhaA family Na+:H+ antiporter
MASESKPADLLPRQPIHVIIAPIRHFMHIESASGVVLLAATAVALAAANSPLGEAFLRFWQQPRIPAASHPSSVQQWINDFF